MKKSPVLFALLLAVGCSVDLSSEDPFDDGGEEDHFHGELDDEEPFYDELADSPGTVAQQLSRCTTRGVMGLSRQLVEEMNCIAPRLLVPLQERNGLRFTGSAVLPYFSPEAAVDLYAAAQTRDIQINSGFRTAVQQHMLYTFRQQRRCRIRAAAVPGRSRHESGKALDLANHGSVSRHMHNASWSQNVPGDWVHFEHQESPDARGVGVLAFQRLWNRNHPEDPIDEDGDYGPDTASRMNRAPAAGFAIGAEGCTRTAPTPPENPGEPEAGPINPDLDLLEVLTLGGGSNRMGR